MRRKLHNSIQLILALATVSAIARAGDGELDAGFAGTGHRLVDVSSGPTDRGQVLRIQPDGKLLMAGTCSKLETSNGHTDPFPKFCATRLRADGSYDTGFGPGGVGYIRFDRFEAEGFPHNSRLSTVLRLEDGRLLFVGKGTEYGKILIAALKPDGSALDPEMADGAGFYEFQIGGVPSSVNVLLEQADGKILLIGQAIGPNGNDDMAVMRLLPDLSIDMTFGNGGYRTVSFDLGGPPGDNSDVALSAALQIDGSIVLAGGALTTSNTAAEIAIARLLPDGQLDPSFGPTHDGRVHAGYDMVSLAEAVRVDAQGRIVYAGVAQSSTISRGVINRLLADGSQDPTFNAYSIGGHPQLFFASPIGGFSFGCLLYDLVVSADGSVFAAGTAIRNTSATTTYFMAVKLTAAGTFAPGNEFGVSGMTYNTFAASAASSSLDNGTSIAIGNGGLMIGGDSTNAAGDDVRFGVARLVLDRLFVNSFEN
ncbi:MAG: hypothetical protein ABI411_16930 [Tahibacter sp.]